MLLNSHLSADNRKDGRKDHLEWGLLDNHDTNDDDTNDDADGG